MNAERLIELYDRVGEAPDAIPRLRRFILDLAVRGKLVEQDPADEPAAKLEERIEEEISRLIKGGQARKPRQFPPPEPEEVPFELPPGWAWSQISRIGVLSPRNDAEDDLVASFVPMPNISADYGVSNNHEPRLWSEIKKGYTHFAEGDVGLAKITPCFENGKSTVFRNLTGGIGSGTTELHIVRPLFVSPDYIVAFLKSPFFIRNGIPRMTGTAGQKRVPLEYFAASPFPLPPLEEQHRIVAKVDELMALCDSLEAEREKGEVTRDQLTTASLRRLTAPDVDKKQFKAHADFAIKVLPELTTRPDQIKVLRQMILDLAVRGKLVEQDPNDEPGSELLKRIRVEKPKIVASEKFKSLEGRLARVSGKFPFSLPKNWTWTYLDDLAAIGRGGSPRPIKSYLTTDPNGIPWIKIGDSIRGSIYIESTKEKIRPEGLSKSRLVLPGDLLLSNSMSFGYPYITNIKGCIHDGWLVIRPPKHLVNKLYLHAVFLSGYAKDVFSGSASGAVVQNLNADKARLLPVPLPPSAEQTRIVAKINKLMALCDELEHRLSVRHDTRYCLLETLLIAALEPVVMEAA